MNLNFEKNLDRILISKNWNNIVLRNDVRADLVDTLNEKLDERIVVEHLYSIDCEQLINLRFRVFKMAKDHYYENLLRNLIKKKPVLKDIILNNTNEYQREIDTSMEEATAAASTATTTTDKVDASNGYVFKCNLIKDIIECLEYMIDLRDYLPERCTDYQDVEPCSFPLGRRHLLTQLNAIKNLRFKILKLQTELYNFKKFTNGLEKMEKNHLNTTNKLRKLQKQNNFLKSVLTILLIIVITCSISILFVNCLNSGRIAPKATI